MRFVKIARYKQNRRNFLILTCEKMINKDFHTHTTYSHGTGSITDNALAAKNKGVELIGITDHGFNHPFYRVKRKLLPQMKAECIAAEKQTGVKVMLGIESNIIGVSGVTDVKPSDIQYLDLYLAGVHRAVLCDRFSDYFKLTVPNYAASVFNAKPSKKLIENCTKAYVNAIKNNPIDVLTHVNYYCFADSLTVAKCCEDYGTYFEINTKKTHLSDEEWQNIIDKTNVKFVVDSDAHSPDRVGDDKLFLSLLSRVNFPMDRIVNVDKPEKQVFLRFSEYKRRNA